MNHRPLFFTVPHSGEVIPSEATWLHDLSAQPDGKLLLLTDVDRFVDELYAPAQLSLQCPMIETEFHRYAVDLNRVPTDISAALVENIPPGYIVDPEAIKKFVSGFHWHQTTTGHKLLPRPMSWATHEALVNRCYLPFHNAVKAADEAVKKQSELNGMGSRRLHFDLHSMPSQGGAAHKDNGQTRPDVVISDCEGLTCHADIKDMVIEVFKQNGFNVSYNWPYKGGRMTQAYGRPAEGSHSLQIELNRALYMSEVSREKHSSFVAIQDRLSLVMMIVGQTLTKMWSQQ